MGLKEVIINNLDIIINFAKWLIGGVTFVFLGLISVIWWLIKQKIKDIDKKRDVITCDAIHNNIIENVISRIKEITRNGSIDNGLGKLSHSPISLGEQDKTIIQETEFNKYVEEIKEKFIDYFNKNRPRNRAEGIKEAVILVMTLDEKREINLDKLKDAGYKIGKTETDIQIIAGVYIWQNIIEPFLYKDVV